MYIILTRVLLMALTLYLLSRWLPGIYIEDVRAAIVAALVIGLLNVFVRPILFLVTLPLTLVTMGFFIFVINAALFFVAAAFLDGFSVAHFGWAFLGSLILSLVSIYSARYLR